MRHRGLPLTLKLPACCILLIGMSVSIALFSWTYRQERHDERAELERRAQFRVATLQQGMNNAVAALQVLNRLFVTNGTVSREQFQVFTQPLLARNPFIEAFAFSALVSQAERPAYEARMRARHPGFAIDVLVDGRRLPAPVKERYRVIEYIEPMAGHEAAVGLDASAQSFPADVVRRAEDSGLASATGLYRLFQGQGTATGFRIFMPVYRAGASVADVASRRQALVGYTLARLRGNELVEKILTSAGPFGMKNLDVRVYGTGSADESKLVYGKAAGGKNAPAQPLFASRPESYARNIDVAGTAWQIVISTQPLSFSSAHSGALLVLLLGLLTTLAATLYAQFVSVGAQRIQHLVAQRTEELKNINQALVASEERARELADLSSDWHWEQDDHFRYTALSSGATGKGGPPAGILVGAIRWEMPVDLKASDWAAHRALLHDHQPFRNFEFKMLIEGTPIRWISCSGKPLFDGHGRFNGYRGTASNISERKAAEEALRQMAGHQESVKEDERKRIARDIHDELGQNLMALRIDLSLMAARPDMLADTRNMAGAALTLIDTTIRAVRSIINDLRPGVLDLGLHAAVEWQARQFEQRSGIVCDLQIDHGEFMLDDKRATALFRIVQESLSNILRHAQASQVHIQMQLREGRLLLRIADDGVGLSAGKRTKANAYGLTGIQERLHAMGGTFSIANNAGGGMALEVSIPI